MNTEVVAEDIDVILSEPVDWSRLADTTVLVTGATGMVGQYVVRALVELGRRTRPIRVLALTRRADRARALFGEPLASGAVELLLQDVAAPIHVDGPVSNVVHAASPASPAAFRTDPVGVIRANVMGTDNVLRLAAAAGGTVCLLSTLEVYGRMPPAEDGSGVLVNEEALGVLDSREVRTAYPQSKRTAENLCAAYGAQHGVGYRIARLSHTYGPGMELSDSRVQAEFLRQAVRGGDIVLQSDGTVRRTYTYVSDAVSALFHLLCTDSDLTCNIANESAYVSLRELAEITLRHGHPTGQVRIAGTDAGGTSPGSGVVLDCSRLRGLGWSPRVDIESGIARTIAHHRAAMGPAARC